MNTFELIDWLKAEHGQWQALLEKIGPARMELPGVVAHWSMKDIVAHLSGWHSTLVGPLQAALHGDPQPPPPWPANLEEDDAINGWIYEHGRERPLSEILAESNQQFEQLFAILHALPDDTPVEVIQQEGREYYLVRLGEERFAPGEFFYHFHEDHEAEIRAWLAKIDTE